MTSTRYRSFFWPALFILAGAVALLVNTGKLAVDRLDLLLNLWPLILVVIGLEIIVRRAVKGETGEIAAALVVLVAVVGAVVYVAAAPNPGTTHVLDVSGPIGDLSNASVEIGVGSATITVSGDSGLGSDLYRARVQYPGSKPEVRFNPSTGRLTIDQANGFQTGRFVVDLQLNPRARWTITENSGAAQDRIDLGNVRVAGLSLNTGASTEDITLGRASGIVPVEVNGGALTVHIHRPGGTAASVAVSGGAVNLNADGKSLHAVGNVSYESPGFGDAQDGYRVRVNGGACNVTLDTSSASS